jgi:tripartite-type tricarboxylate transporter receptor subunit TctC
MKIKMFRRKYHQGTGSFGPVEGILAFLLLVSSFSILVPPVHSGAKDWPTKTITLIIPWPAGGGTDVAGRILAPKLSKILGVPIQTVNKPGGSGIIGTLEAVKAPSDGYTLFIDCGGTSSIQYAWSENLPYKVEERTYIARATSTPRCLIVPASSPWKTVEDLVNSIRTNPSGITFALIGGTGVPDVVIAQFRAALIAKGVDVSKSRPISYKGTGEVVVAIAGGHASFSAAGPDSASALTDAGKIRVLGVTSAGRYKGWPNVPTMTEAGFPSVDMVFWVGLSSSPGLPANIVKILDNAVRESLNDPDVIAKLDKIGIEPFYQSGDKYRKFVLDEGEAIKALKLR